MCVYVCVNITAPLNVCLHFYITLQSLTLLTPSLSLFLSSVPPPLTCPLNLSLSHPSRPLLPPPLHLYLIQCLPLSRGATEKFSRGAQVYICNRKDEMIHGLSPSVKCVAPLLRDMSLDKVYVKCRRGCAPQAPPPLQLRPLER